MTQHARDLVLDLADPDQIIRFASIKLKTAAIEEARQLLEQALAVHPNEPRLLNLMGNLHVIDSTYKVARHCYERSLAINPGAIDTLLNLANLSHLDADLEQAQMWAEKALDVDRHSVEAQFRLSLIATQQGHLDTAKNLLDGLLLHAPDFTPALNHRARLLLERGEPIVALHDLNRSIDLDPNQIEAIIDRGDIFLAHKQAAAAAIDYETALGLGAQSSILYHNYGKALAYLKRIDEARAAFTRSAECKPNAPEPLFALGTVSLEEKDFGAAIAYFTAALANDPSHCDSLNNRAIAYKGLNDYKSALEDYQQVLAINPDDARAYQNAAVTCLEIKDYSEALTLANRAIDIAPNGIDAYLVKGHILADMASYDEAIAAFELAKTKQPEDPAPYLQLGNINRLKREYDQAISAYKAALERGSNDRYLRGDLIFTKLQTCAWDGIETEIDTLITDIGHGHSSISPFIFLTFSDNPQQQRSVAEDYVKTLFPKKNDIDPIEFYKGHQKIRLGYYSADFNNHATMHLMANLFEVHDRERFELYAFSFGPQKSDKMRVRAEAAFDHFIDVSEYSDKAVALVSRYLEIDIAVDLKGYTTHSRPNIFAYRAAPVQINYLGFPGTMGADFIDYIIADPTIIPAKSEAHYREKVLRLPNCYQVNDQKRPPLVLKFSRSEMGLPEDKFVFCSFNNNYKILPQMLNTWAEILKSVPDSIFWILADNKTAERNLATEFDRRGVDRNRLVFAERMPSELHLARQSCADLFLDTYPCAAHTTASDAVFAGLPILTLKGEALASRVSASILYSVGLPDLVTDTFDDYKKRAIELGLNSSRCHDFSQYLKKTVRLSPLFNTKKLARDLENLYTKVLDSTALKNSR